MYESFGAFVTGSAVEFRLFFPDNSRDAGQYARGGLPHIQNLRVVGSFQPALGHAAWDRTTAPDMTRTAHQKGWLYKFSIPHLPDGYYEYKYFVEFENGTSRWCGDPCTRYGGSEEENSAFVVGGNDMRVPALGERRPLADLVIYELMLDDFTDEFRGARAPLDAVHDKIPHLLNLGVNAVELMPWTAWPGSSFSWGYNPFAFFSVEYRYYQDPAAPLDKLFRLKRLIDKLHRNGMHVVMDGVFNHVDVGTDPGRGFAYYWLYQDPAESPYIGTFERGGFFEELDYANGCTAEFVGDVCRYWLEEYQVDGIRFDYALGFDRRSDTPVGLARVIEGLNEWMSADAGRANIAFTLELLTDNRYAAVGRTNQLGATGCWYDQLMWDLFDAGRGGHTDTRLIRGLNSGKDFDSGRRPVTYIENHDHSTLTEHSGGRAAWWRTQPLAIALMTICGAPMIHNGQEWGEQYWFPEDGPERVRPRPLRWAQLNDGVGGSLLSLYKRLIEIRLAHPALRSRNFYPDPYDEQLTQLNEWGYGLDESRDLVIFHRWGTDDRGRLERFIVALNFSGYDQRADIPFPVNGRWENLLDGSTVEVADHRSRNHLLTSHWGSIFWHAS